MIVKELSLGSQPRLPRVLWWPRDSGPPLPACRAFLPFLIISLFSCYLPAILAKLNWALCLTHNPVLPARALGSGCIFAEQVLRFLFPVKTLPFIPGPDHEAFPSLPNQLSSLFNSGNCFGASLPAASLRFIFLCIPMAPMAGLSADLRICWMQSLLKVVQYCIPRALWPVPLGVRPKQAFMIGGVTSCPGCADPVDGRLSVIRNRIS